MIYHAFNIKMCTALGYQAWIFCQFFGKSDSVFIESDKNWDCGSKLCFMYKYKLVVNYF